MSTFASDSPSITPTGDGVPPRSGDDGTPASQVPMPRDAFAESQPTEGDAVAPAVEQPAVAYAKIYPGIGFARVGNSPDQFILGPEVPGRPVDAEGRFKDRQGRIKRQAARFRVYGFAADGEVRQELTAADADITWTVHVANKKAAWAEFRGAAAEAQAEAGGTPLPLRNQAVVDRDTLVIDPGPQSVGGIGQTGPRFDAGRFQGIPVELGELRTDD